MALGIALDCVGKKLHARPIIRRRLRLMFFHVIRQLTRLREKEEQESDHQPHGIALEKLRRARGEHGNVVQFKILHQTHYILVLHRVEEKGNLIEVGDDLLRNKRIDKRLHAVAPAVHILARHAHDAGTIVERLVRLRGDCLVVAKSLLSVLPVASVHPAVVERDDVLVRTEVRIEHDGLARPLGKIIGKLQDIPNRRASEPVNGLVFVAHHAYVSGSSSKLQEYSFLNGVRVLIFIDNEILDLRTDLSQNIGVRFDERKHFALNRRKVNRVLALKDFTVEFVRLAKRLYLGFWSGKKRFGIDGFFAHLVQIPTQSPGIRPIRLRLGHQVEILNLAELVHPAIDGVALVKVIKRLVVLL